MRGIEFTIKTISFVVLLLIVLLTIFTFFATNFAKGQELLNETMVTEEKVEESGDIEGIFEFFGICDEDATWECVQTKPFDDEPCGEGLYESKSDCSLGNAFGGGPASIPCSTRDASEGKKYQGSCFCKCISP